jgi:hypothetical protein
VTDPAFVLRPDDFLEVGQRFLRHVGCERRIPIGKLFRMGS